VIFASQESNGPNHHFSYSIGWWQSHLHGVWVVPAASGLSTMASLQYMLVKLSLKRCCSKYATNNLEYLSYLNEFRKTRVINCQFFSPHLLAFFYVG